MWVYITPGDPGRQEMDETLIDLTKQIYNSEGESVTQTHTQTGEQEKKVI